MKQGSVKTIISPRKNTAKSLARQLKLMAIENGPDYKLPTTRELCLRFSTAPATLNDALAVLESQNVIYRRQGSGIFVSKNLNRKNIEVLINAYFVDRDSVSPFWGILWGHLVKEGQNRAAHKNEEIHFQLTASDPKSSDAALPEILRAVDAGYVHGVLTVGMGEPSVLHPIERDVPLVAYAGPGHWQVGIDESHIVREVVRRLAAQGCKNIAYWRHYEFQNAGCVDEDLFWRQSVQLFQSALETNGIPFHPELFRIGGVALSEIAGDLAAGVHAGSTVNSQDQGYLSALRTFSQSAAIRPDALLITDDMLTAGALAALHELRIRPGEDVMIASHSNVGSPLLKKWEPHLMLWETDAAELVSVMFDLLDRVMAGERPETRQVYVPLRFREP